MKHGVPQGLILGPLFFLLFVNDLSKIISDKSNPVLFADYMGINVTNSNSLAFVIISWHVLRLQMEMGMRYEG